MCALWNLRNHAFAGLPPFPPSLTSASATINDQPNHGIDNDGMAIKPLGVDVPRRRKNRISRNVVIVIVLSCTTTVVVCMGLVWLLLLKCGYCTYETDNDPNLLITTHVNPAGINIFYYHLIQLACPVYLVK